MGRNDFEAKKVFFLYPHSVIQQELVKELVSNEFEVYLVTDHQKLRILISEYEQPIVFVNIDEHMGQDEWQDYIEELMNADDNTAQIGIVTYNEDPDLAQHYLMELMIPCGFIKLKIGLEQSKEIILKTLEANEAKGRRKYLRMDCWEYKNTEFNVNIQGRLCTGKIKDISSVGMAFVFDDDMSLPKNTMISDIQLKLKGKIARVSGPMIGARVTPEGIVMVLIFDKRTEPVTRTRIHTFIYEALQEQIQLKLRSIS